MGKKQPDKKPVGRPRKQFDPSKWPTWKADILGLYIEGASDVEVKALIITSIPGKLRLSNDLWERWLEDEQEFSETIKNGRLLSAAWWERQGRKSLNDKSFNAVLWYMNMRNRFKWRNEPEPESQEEGKKDQGIKYKGKIVKF